MYYKKLQMKIVIINLLLLFFSIASQAQTNFWHFGNGITFTFEGKKINLSFNKNLATSVTGRESFSIQDKSGKLKFYTDGISMWNERDKLVDSTLLGEYSVVGAPHPNSDNLYYLFYVGNAKKPKSYQVADKVNYKKLTPADTISDNRLTMLKTKLYYTLIDLKAEKIIEKNVLLAESILTNCCILKHKNRKDYWIVAHDFKTNQFRTFLLNEKGINKSPVLSKMGGIYTKNTYKIIRWELALYYLKGNVLGNLLYIKTIQDDDHIDLFKFDNQKGKVIDSKVMVLKKEKDYYINHWDSFELSSNSKYLYKISFYNNISGNIVSFVEQYAINQIDSIKSIKKIILPTKKQALYSQLAPNGNIYITTSAEGGLITITKTNDTLDLKNIIFDEIILPEGKKEAGTMPKINHLLPLEDEAKPVIEKNVPFSREILFETNQAVLKPEYETELQDIIDFLKQNPTSTIEIAGHTDNEGEEAKNKTLSENRAKALANFLIKNKIETTHIKAIGYGSTKPIADNTTPAGRAKNRRIEFLISEKK